MKKIQFTTKAFALASVLLCAVLTSCQDDAGITSKILTGEEQKLPDELKGLKVYWVSTGYGSGVKVAILNGQINSTTYQVGKTNQSTIILNKQNSSLIEVRQILVENDSVIVCRK